MTKPISWNAGVYAGTSPWRSLKITNITVGTTATALPTTNLVNRKGMWLFNTTSTKVFLGDITVDSSKELILFGSQQNIFPIDTGVTIYGRVPSGTVLVIVWEFT